MRLLFILQSIILVSSFELEGLFDKCSVGNPRKLLDTNSIDCNNMDSTVRDVLRGSHASKDHSAWIFGRSEHVVNGMGVECWMRVLTVKYQYHMLKSNERTEILSAFVELSAQQCARMVNYHECRGEEMKCESRSSCSFKQPETFDYGWEPIVRNFYSCGFEPRLIIAASMTDTVVPAELAKSACTPSSLNCSMAGRVVIWEQSIVNQCTLHTITLLADVKELRGTVESNGIYKFTSIFTELVC